jgi:hypothetical protein
MATFGMLACCYWSARNPDWRLAAVAGLAAGSAYLPAVALIPGLLAASVVTRNRQVRTAMFLGTAGVAAGAAGVLVYAQASVGQWDQYFTGKSHEFGVGVHNPLVVISARLRSFAPLLGSGDRAIAEQAILVGLLLALALAGAPVPAGAGAPAPVGALPPYIACGRLSVYRDEAMTLVVVPLLRHLPKWSLALPLLAAIWVAAGMATLFFGDVLR